MNKTALILLIMFILGSGLCAQNTVPEPLVSTNQPSFMDSLRTALPDSLNSLPAKLDSLFYAGDSIRFLYQDERIYLYGNTSIDYANSQISADSLFIDLKKEQAISYGLTRMQDNGQLLIGTDVSYDVGSQTGMLRQGQSYIENGYYSGAEIRKVSSDIYDIDGGSFTTCDLAEPSYWFGAKSMRIYRGDKVVGKHVVAYVNHLPIMYFPFITMSIKRGRHPGFLIPEPGYNSVDGKYVRDIAWYYPYKDYADLILSLDLKEKTGWRTNFKTVYLQRYLYNGNLSATYQKTINSAGTVYDWALRGYHHHDLPEQSALDISLDFVSNKRIWEGSDILDESLAQRLFSSVAYRKPIGNTYLNVGALYNQDLINDTASLSLPS
ncbi:MAG TPA: putative LPS assembly protein LptD, partial [Candidatus Cloacimonadota bacterium]|nr:putative LPS assembly protein LptD [Candidatus Cloacimonadota bacterium]